MTTTNRCANRSWRRRTPPRILLAEDDFEMRALLADQLRQAGYLVIECCDGQGLVERLAWLFLDHVRAEQIDLVITDIRMPAYSGLDILEGLNHDGRLPPVIFITAFGEEETHARARRLGAIATFDKPFRIPDLLERVRETIGDHPPRTH